VAAFMADDSACEDPIGGEDAPRLLIARSPFEIGYCWERRSLKFVPGTLNPDRTHLPQAHLDLMPNGWVRAASNSWC
jgi:hypothetical protein